MQTHFRAYPVERLGEEMGGAQLSLQGAAKCLEEGMHDFGRCRG